MRGGPGVGDAAPSDGDEEGGCGGYEEDGTDPIDATELRGEVCGGEVQFEEDDHKDDGDTDDGEVHVENPAPGHVLSKGAPNDGAGYGS